MNACILLMSLGAHALGQSPMPPALPTNFASAPMVAAQPLLQPAPLPLLQPVAALQAVPQAPPAPPALEPVQTVTAPPAVSGPLPDPTKPSGPFQDLMKQKATGPGPSNRAPALALRGRVIAAGKEPSAMVEVDGKLALVTAGSVLAYGNSTVRVVEITSQEVRLEIGSSSEKLSLR
jgi:hypothetical protein